MFLFGVALVCVGLITFVTIPNNTPRRRLVEGYDVTVYNAGFFGGSSSFKDGATTCKGTFSYWKEGSIFGSKHRFIVQLQSPGVGLQGRKVNLSLKEITSVTEFYDAKEPLMVVSETDPEEPISFIIRQEEDVLDKKWVKETIKKVNPLLSGWEEAKAENGQMFYYKHDKTCWKLEKGRFVPPPPQPPTFRSAVSSTGIPLPPPEPLRKPSPPGPDGEGGYPASSTWNRPTCSFNY